MAKIQPGILPDYVCAECGERVSIDAQGKALCYFCGRLVAYVPADNLKQVRRPRNLRRVIEKEWGERIT